MSHMKIEQEEYTGNGTAKKCVEFGELKGR